jgi:hypothetical protein
MMPRRHRALAVPFWLALGVFGAGLAISTPVAQAAPIALVTDVVGDATRAASPLESLKLLVRDDRFSAPSTEFTQRVAGVIQQITADPRLHIRSQTGWSPLPARSGMVSRPRCPHNADDTRARYRRRHGETGSSRGRARLLLQRRRVAGLPGGSIAAFAATSEVGTAAHARRTDLVSAGGGDPDDPVPVSPRR